MTYYIYILLCQNNSFYIGYTTDIERRYQEHLDGSTKCKYTRSFPPKKIAACWQTQALLADVMHVERTLKRLSKSEKIELVSDPLSISDWLDIDVEFELI